MSDMTQDEAIAYADLIGQMDTYKQVTRGRNELIRRAAGMGMPQLEIARRLNVSRDTVIRILGKSPEDATR